MRSYYEASVRTRSRRLRALAERALSRHRLRVVSLRRIPNTTNALFVVRIDTGERLVLRVYDPSGCHGPDDIERESRWLDALAADTTLVVPVMRRTRDGRRFTTESIPGMPEPRHAVVFGWVPGRTIGATPSLTDTELWGTLAAELHEHAARFVLPGPPPRPHASALPYANAAHPPVEPNRLAGAGADERLSARTRRVFADALARVSERVEHFWSRSAERHVIHADLHPWNVRVAGGRAHAIDFEDMLLGHAAHDVAIGLHHIRDRSDWAAHLTAFKRGYEHVRAWPDLDDEDLDVLIAGRALVLCNFVLNARDPHLVGLAADYVRKVEARVAGLVAPRRPPRRRSRAQGPRRRTASAADASVARHCGGHR